MYHIDLQALTFKKEFFGEHLSYDVIVNITVDSPDRRVLGQFVGQIGGAPVTSMPYLISSFRGLNQAVIYMAMGV